MGVTVQVRDLDGEVQQTLKTAAVAEGLSLSEYLRRALAELADRIRVQQRWAEGETEFEERRRQPRTPWKPIRIDPEIIVEGREER